MMQLTPEEVAQIQGTPLALIYKARELDQRGTTRLHIAATLLAGMLSRPNTSAAHSVLAANALDQADELMGRSDALLALERKAFLVEHAEQIAAEELEREELNQAKAAAPDEGEVTGNLTASETVAQMELVRDDAPPTGAEASGMDMGADVPEPDAAPGE